MIDLKPNYRRVECCANCSFVHFEDYSNLYCNVDIDAPLALLKEESEGYLTSEDEFLLMVWRNNHIVSEKFICDNYLSLLKFT